MIFLCFWPHGRESLVLFIDYINTLYPTQKIKFNMEVAETCNYLEFLDLKLKWENGKITVDVHSKPTDSFTYVLPTTCHPMKSINYVPHSISLRFRNEFVIQITNLIIRVKNTGTT